MAATSDGLIAMLNRKGIKPSGDSAKDIELARGVMPPSYKEKKNDRTKKEDRI